MHYTPGLKTEFENKQIVNTPQLLFFENNKDYQNRRDYHQSTCYHQQDHLQVDGVQRISDIVYVKLLGFSRHYTFFNTN